MPILLLLFGAVAVRFGPKLYLKPNLADKPCSVQDSLIRSRLP